MGNSRGYTYGTGVNITVIKKGDRVLIIWEDRRVWATIIHTPRGEGDLWQYKTDNGEVVALNPYARYFIRMEKVDVS